MMMHAFYIVWLNRVCLDHVTTNNHFLSYQFYVHTCVSRRAGHEARTTGLLNDSYLIPIYNQCMISPEIISGMLNMYYYVDMYVHTSSCTYAYSASKFACSFSFGH